MWTEVTVHGQFAAHIDASILVEGRSLNQRGPQGSASRAAAEEGSVAAKYGIECAQNFLWDSPALEPRQHSKIEPLSQLQAALHIYCYAPSRAVPRRIGYTTAVLLRFI